MATIIHSIIKIIEYSQYQHNTGTNGNSTNIQSIFMLHSFGDSV